MINDWAAEACRQARERGAVVIAATRRAAMAGAAQELEGRLPVLRFPPLDTLPYDRAGPTAAVTGARLAALASLVLRPADQPLALVTTVRAALGRLPMPDDVRSRSRRLGPDGNLSLSELKDWLGQAGYVEADPADEPGEMALRDGQLDVYPPGAAQALRVMEEHGGIARLQWYDPQTQRTTGNGADQALLPPGDEIPWGKAAIERFLGEWKRRFGLSDHPMVEAVRAGRRPRHALQWLPLFAGRTATLFDYLPGAAVLVEADADGEAEDWLERLQQACQLRLRMTELETASGLPPFCPLPPDETSLTLDRWRGIARAILPSPLPLAMATAADAAETPAVAADALGIRLGDLVVHPDHGIGMFDGIETIETGGIAEDCLRVLYAGNDKLLVPAQNADLLYRHGGEAARLDRLGGPAWSRRRDRVRNELSTFASTMVGILQGRREADCPPLPKPPGYDRFAAAFPFEETPGQLRAIADVLSDLASGRPMDRLVCGDVGFGKTEVALRAAFVVAAQGRQVAVIAPTTPLCRQHYDDFRRRFAGWPWPIHQMSRGMTAAEIRRVKAEVEKGGPGVVVGTQALLGLDLPELGMVVIDEEQRLGAADKERLRQFGPCVHMLVMTATPIPRTLQMALSGLRDMSLIRTPPVARRPVRTYVLPFDPVTLRQAFLREQRRGGQSIVICPRIQEIAPLRQKLAEFVPEFELAVAHGRLAPVTLDRTLAAFADGRYDILLATNIIETGLNLPGANTLVVHRSDMFGLSALHQLRGRVGRGSRQAFAYMTHDPDAELSDAARHRLETIAALSSPGSGFDLALRDRELRGSGAVLGEAQAGHRQDLGAEYIEALTRQAIAEASGGPARPAAPDIHLGVTARLPETYIPDPSIRLAFYRRLAAAEEPATAIETELADRFGPPPEEARLCVAAHGLARLCRRRRIVELEAGPRGAVLAFADAQARDEFAGRVAAKPRDDGRLAVHGEWEDPRKRAEALRQMLS